MTDFEDFSAEGIDCFDALVIKVIHQDMSLLLDGPSCAQLGPGQAVVWQFENVPDGWIPYIVFFEGVEDPLGPFEALHQAADQVIATGNDGCAGRFTYVAMLRDSRSPRMNVLVSPQADLIQGADAVIEVVVDLENGQFLIDPQEVRIKPGQSVYWSFPNLAPEYLPEISFYRWQESKLKDVEMKPVGRCGPFKILSRMRGGILGSGRGPEVQGRYAYFVDLTCLDLAQSHQALEYYKSEDPFVDTDPPPPPDDDPEDPPPGGKWALNPNL